MLQTVACRVFDTADATKAGQDRSKLRYPGDLESKGHNI